MGMSSQMHGLELMNRFASFILDVVTGICGAVLGIGYALPATSISDLTNSNIVLWIRLLNLVLIMGAYNGRNLYVISLAEGWAKK
jgi:hypothetical protein